MKRAGKPRQSLGLVLKEWRRIRRKSQLTVALEAGISPRHLSFVESGRSTPSREMVLTLAQSLEVPLRERNTLLAAAGYASMFPEHPLDSIQLAPVHRAVSRLLEHQEPYPAVLLDRHWNLVENNRSAPRLFSLFVDLTALPQPRNLLRSMFHPAGLAPFVENWDEVARTLVRRVFREAVSGVPDDRTLALLEEVRGYCPAAFEQAPVFSGDSLPFHPVVFRKNDLRLSFFSLVTTVGAPTDITAQELRIEALFPSDDTTEQFAKARW